MRDVTRTMLPSESTLRSAAPTSLPDPSEEKEVERVVIAGGTLVELHPARLGQADILIEGSTVAQVVGEMPAAWANARKVPSSRTRAASALAAAASATSHAIPTVSAISGAVRSVATTTSTSLRI